MADEGKTDWNPSDDELMELFEGSDEGKAFVDELGSETRSCTTEPQAGACKTADGKTGVKYKIVCVSSDGKTTTSYYCSAV